jgi:hypothetical protein
MRLVSGLSGVLPTTNVPAMCKAWGRVPAGGANTPPEFDREQVFLTGFQLAKA